MVLCEMVTSEEAGGKFGYGTTPRQIFPIVLTVIVFIDAANGSGRKLHNKIWMERLSPLSRGRMLWM